MRAALSAIIEFVKGEPTIHLGKQYQVMTNEPAYDQQIANLLRYKVVRRARLSSCRAAFRRDERFVARGLFR